MPLSFFATPDSTQSFAQNYHDHLSYFFKSYHTTSTRGLPTPLILRPMVPFTKLRFHQAFHDAYDVVDEIVSATLVPPFLVLASAYRPFRTLRHTFTN